MPSSASPRHLLFLSYQIHGMIQATGDSGHICKVWLLNNPIMLPRWHSGKESICPCRRYWRRRFNPWVRKIPWRRKWQPTPVFLPGKSHGQRSLEGYSPWGRPKKSWTQLSMHTHISSNGSFQSTGGLVFLHWCMVQLTIEDVLR